MRLVALLSFAVAGVGFSFSACGGSSASVTSDDAGTGPNIPVPEAGTERREAGVDGGTDADAAVDADAEAPTGALNATLIVDTFFQDCMPIVNADPVTMQGNMKITNNGAVAAGPLVFKSGTFLDADTLTPISTFAVDTTTQVVAPGATIQTLVEKTPKSMKPGGGCQTLACNKSFVVELSYTGPGAAKGAAVRAPAKKLSCAF